MAAWRRRPSHRRDLAAALGRITAKTFVLPIDEDMFLPPCDCAYQQAMISGSELRVLPSVAGHFGLFGFEQTYLAAVDQVLGTCWPPGPDGPGRGPTEGALGPLATGSMLTWAARHRSFRASGHTGQAGGS